MTNWQIKLSNFFADCYNATRFVLLTPRGKYNRKKGIKALATEINFFIEEINTVISVDIARTNKGSCQLNHFLS